MIEDQTVLLTLFDILSLYLEKYTLLILHCRWCPALVKTSICQGLHKDLQNDRSGCLSWWSPRKNGTDRKFMTLNYIKVTSVNIMSKELFIFRGFFFNYINIFWVWAKCNEKIFLVYSMIIQMFQKYTLDHPGIRKILIVDTVCQLKPMTFKRDAWRYYRLKIGQTIWL